MILTRILPGVLKELSKHVPTVLFQTVEWSDLASEIPKISRRILQKEGYDELYQIQKEVLDPYNITLTTESLNDAWTKDKAFGEKLLTLYFTQLFSPHGLFLDIRSHHFQQEKEILKWHPSAFWVKLNEDFRQGILKVYEGFYLEKEQLYFEGLEQIGLLKKDFSQEDKKILADLFRAQFGSALTEEMSFDLEHFNHSIIKMSEFMLNKKVNISKDFLYLGIYLVAMYASLEETKAKFPVKQIYLDVRGRFSAKEVG